MSHIMSEEFTLKVFWGLIMVFWVLVPMDMLYLDTAPIKEVAQRNTSGKS